MISLLGCGAISGAQALGDRTAAACDAFSVL